MKSDFMLAITQLSAEKNLPKEVVLKAVESALVSAYRKDNFAATQNIQVKINPNNGKVEVWVEKLVVDVLADPRKEITLSAAKKIKPDAEVGQAVYIEDTPQNAGRIAAQTAKQVILQRLHEAEHSAIFEEYANKEGDIIVGIVQHIDPKQVSLDIGRTEAVLPISEQVHGERYRIGQRVKVYLLEIAKTTKGPRVIVSRTHPNLTKRLFELEVPEVQSGIVEIKGIAREAGYRSKVAVAAKQPGIDPVGCCVGLRGIRIQNIVNELNGEKLDVVAWDPEPAVFIANALSPAKAVSVKLDEKEGIATVIVPDKLLSLAIGKEGQNARLAAKVTGWRIDIKAASTVEGFETVEAPPHPVEELKKAPEVQPVPVPEMAAAAAVPVEAVEPAPAEQIINTPPKAPAPKAPAPEVIETTLVMPRLGFRRREEKGLRFAEEILKPEAAVPGKLKDKKKKQRTTSGKEREDEGKGKKRVDLESFLDTEEEV